MIHPFDPLDGDKLREECGLFGVFGLSDAATFTALGLHALQHRGQEAGGIATWCEDQGFSVVKRLGYVRDSFTSEETMRQLPGRNAMGHVRYSTSGEKGHTALRDVQPLYADFATGGFAVAHNGNLVNAESLKRDLIERGSLFQSSSDTEVIVHLMARSFHRAAAERMKEALRRVEGAFSVIGLSSEQMIGARDPRGIRPLVLDGSGRAGSWRPRPAPSTSSARHSSGRSSPAKW